jgi:hypothetical protein
MSIIDGRKQLAKRSSAVDYRISKATTRRNHRGLLLLGWLLPKVRRNAEARANDALVDGLFQQRIVRLEGGM